MWWEIKFPKSAQIYDTTPEIEIGIPESATSSIAQNGGLQSKPTNNKYSP